MGTKSDFYVDIMSLHPETTGSCILCIVKLPNKETMRFIVDCGLFFEQEHQKYNKTFPFDADKIDFALITHNHTDHTGRIPLLYNKGYDGKIFCSSITKRLLPTALYDTFKIIGDISKRNHEKPLYRNQDVEKAIDNLYGMCFNVEYELNENIKVTFLENGHLLGSAMILVNIHYPDRQDINLLFTGDYKKSNLFFDVSDIPEYVRKLSLTIVTEATYGYMTSEEIKHEFSEKMEKAISESKDIIIPVFSLGRAQEILYEVKKLKDKGGIPSNYNMYFDGKLAQIYTSIYLSKEVHIKEEMYDFLPEGLIYVNKESRMDVINDKENKIIITTAGMATYGPAKIYLPKFLPKKNVLVLFSGYMAEGTLGRSLLNAQDDDFVKVAGLIVKKRAEISNVNEFSAHAKADEITDLLKKFENLNFILVNHGEEDSKEKLAKRIIEEIEPKDIGILNREYFFRVNAFGVIKTLSTKFS